MTDHRNQHNQHDETPLDLITYQDGALNLNVRIDRSQDTVWLSQRQMAELFDVTSDNISLHIRNVYGASELDEEATAEFFSVVQKEGNRSVRRRLKLYNLDIILAVGYRVNSKRGSAFRKWASDILKQYMIQGYVHNQRRLNQLGRTIQIMQRVRDKLQASQVLNVISAYTAALDLLDDYDRQRVEKPSGREATQSLTYQECRAIIDDMRFGAESNLFGNEKDDSFHGILAAIEQTFGGQPLYPTLEEKAANLLYFIVKDHSFSDGNKRIAAAIFLHYLHKNNALFSGERKRIADDTLVALIIMLAESKPREKETMVNLVMQFLQEPIVQEAHEHA